MVGSFRCSLFAFRFSLFAFGCSLLAVRSVLFFIEFGYYVADGDLPADVSDDFLQAMHS
jgi:hypothetical protein